MPVKRRLESRNGFGSHLKKLILEAGYTSVDNFSRANEFDRVTIWRIIEKDSDPKLSMILKLINALEIDANKLLKWNKKD